MIPDENFFKTLYCDYTGLGYIIEAGKYYAKNSTLLDNGNTNDNISRSNDNTRHQRKRR